MANNTVNLTLQVRENGLKAIETSSANINKNLTGAAKQSQGIGGAPRYSSYKDAARDDGIEYGRARAGVGTGAAGRDFAKQSQGLGGLVHLYATFAANIFAVGAAYEALNKAAQTERLIKASSMMSVQVGANLNSISKNLVEASGHALSFTEAMQFTNIGTSAGLAGKQIESLTKIARGAASALGRDANDSVRRIIQGTAKQEQEILDELGIFVKSKQAFEKYANQIGVKVDDLTGRQRTQAYANEVERLGEKWKSFAEIDDPFSRFAATGKNALTELLNSVNAFVKPVIAMFAESEGAVKGLIALVTTVLAKRALPEIGGVFNSVFNYDKQMGAAKHAEMMRDLDKSLSDVEKKIADNAAKIAAIRASSSVQSGRDAIYKEVGSSAAVLNNGKYAIPGIKQRLLATELVGTDKNPKNLALLTSELAVQEKVTLNIKNQLKDEATRAQILASLVQLGTVEVGSTAENLVLTQRTKDVSAGIYNNVIVPMAAKQAQLNSLTADQNVQLQTQNGLLARQKELGSLMPGVTTKNAGTAPIVAAGTAAEVTANTALAESQAKVALTANEEALALNKVAVAQTTTTEATILATSANNKEAVSNELSSAALKKKTADEILSMKGTAAKAGSDASLLFSQGIKGILPALGELGTGMKAALAGFTTTASGAKILAGSLTFVKLGLQGIIGTLGALITPLMLAYTVWELFGDTIKKWIPDSIKAMLGMDDTSKALSEVTKKMTEYTASIEIAGANLEMLNKVRAKGFESAEAEASFASSVSKNINTQIEEYKKLTEEKDKATRVQLIEEAKKAATSMGMVFSEQAYAIKGLQESIKGLGLPTELLQSIETYRNKVQELDSRRAKGMISEQEYHKQYLDLLAQYQPTLQKVSDANNKYESSTSGAVAAVKKANDALSDQVDKNKKLGDSTLQLNNIIANDVFKGYTSLLASAITDTNKLQNAETLLFKTVELGGKTAAEAIPMWVAYNYVKNALNNATDMSVQEKEAHLVAWLKQQTEAFLGIARTLNTVKPPKATPEYDEKDRTILRELKRDIEAAKLEQLALDKAFANTSSIDKRMASLIGYQSEISIASEKNNADAKAELDYTTKLDEARKSLYESILSSTRTKEDKQNAIDAYIAQIKQLGVMRDTQHQAARIAQEDASIAVIVAKIKLEQEQYNASLNTQTQIQKDIQSVQDAELEAMKERGIYSEQYLINLDYQIQKESLLASIGAQRVKAESDRNFATSQVDASLSWMPTGTNEQREDKEIARADALAKVNAEYARQIALIDSSASSAQRVLEITKDQKSAVAAINKELAEFNKIGDLLAKSFGKVGAALGGAVKAVGKMAVDDKRYLTTKLKLEDDIKDAKKSSSPEAEKQAVKELSELESTRAQDRLDSIAEIAGSTKQMFSEHTAAYKVLNAVEQASHVASMVMSLEKMMAAAGIAILEQGKGDPYSAFARMAAMATFVGAILSSFGGSSAPSMSIPGGMSAEDQQKSQGTGQSWVDGKLVDNGGGVFGDTAAKSESIAKSLELIEETSYEGIIVANEQVELLRNISKGITNISEASYGIEGIRTGSGFGTTEGSSSNPGFLGLFASSESTEIINAGIKLKGTFESLGVAGNGVITQFETVAKSWSDSGFFGIGADSGTDISTNEKPLETKAERAIRDTFGYMSELLIDSGKLLGLTAEESISRVNGLSVDITASLRGLTGKETTEELNAVFGSILDDAYAALAPKLKQFRKFGEGFSTTVVRVLDGFSKVNLGFSLIGLSAIDLVETASKATTEMYDNVSAAKAKVESARAAVPKEIIGEVGDPVFENGSYRLQGVTNQAEITAAQAILDEAEQEYLNSVAILDEANSGMTTRNYELSEALIDAAGGVDKFVENIEAVANRLLDPSQRLGIQNNSVAKYLRDISTPKLSDQVTVGPQPIVSDDAAFARDFFTAFSDNKDGLIDTKEEYLALIAGVDALAKSETASAEDRSKAVTLYTKLTESSTVEAFANMAEAADTYRERMYSASELATMRQLTLEKNLNRIDVAAAPIGGLSAAMDAVGLKSLKTNKDFRTLVDSLTGTDEHTVTLRNSLIALAPAFADIADAMDDALKSLQNSINEYRLATGSTTELAIAIAQQNQAWNAFVEATPTLDSGFNQTSTMQWLANPANFGTLDQYLNPEQINLLGEYVSSYNTTQNIRDQAADNNTSTNSNTSSSDNSASFDRLAYLREREKEILIAQYKAFDVVVRARQEEILSLNGDIELINKRNAAYAAQDLNAVQSKQLDLLKEQGYEYTALQIEREREISNLRYTGEVISTAGKEAKAFADAMIETQEAIYLARDAQKTRSLNIRILELEGKTKEALTERRKDELKALSDSDRVLQNRIWMLEDEAKLTSAIKTQNITLTELLYGKEASLALQREQELANMDEQLRPRQEYIWALQDEADARDALKDKITSNIDALKGMIESLDEAKRSMLIGDSSTLTPEQRYAEAKRQMDEVVLTATSSAVTEDEIARQQDAISKLPDITSQFLEASSGLFASSEQYTQDFTSVLSILDTTKQGLIDQKSTAELQLDSLGGIQNTLTNIEDLTRKYNDASMAVISAFGTYLASGTGGVGSGSDIALTIIDTLKAVAVSLVPITTPVYVPPTAPIVDLTPVVEEIKNINVKINSLISDNKEQTGHIISSQNNNAEVVATAVTQSTSDTIKGLSWASRTEVKLA